MSDEKPTKVKVRIRASQTVKYSQVVEMDPEDWEHLNAALEEGDETDDDVQQLLDGYIDLMQVQEGDSFEDVEAELYLEKPAKPPPAEEAT